MQHIIGKIGDTAEVEKLHPLFPKAFAFLRRPDFATLPVGTYELAPDMKAMIQEVDLKAPGAETQRVEAHGKFIDIQSPISGPEVFGLATIDPASPDYHFDADRDVGFLDVPAKPVMLEPGDFAVFFPPDGAHAPCLAAGEPVRHKKVVIKIPVVA